MLCFVLFFWVMNELCVLSTYLNLEGEDESMHLTMIGEYVFQFCDYGLFLSVLKLLL